MHSRRHDSWETETKTTSCREAFSKKLKEDGPWLISIYICTLKVLLPKQKRIRGAYRNEGAYWVGAFFRIGVIISKKEFRWMALITKRALIGRRARNRIIMVSFLAGHIQLYDAFRPIALVHKYLMDYNAGYPLPPSNLRQISLTFHWYL